ncbi:MAG: hypothetical protein FJZ92_01375 [Chloroflexi bacterium]|nr:hypothetical protein [Chloroflexota bacterium]
MGTALFRFVLHHSEAVDPTLARWLRDEIDHLLGLPTAAYVGLLGAAIVAFPLGLLWMARRRGPNPGAQAGEGSRDRGQRGAP